MTTAFPLSWPQGWPRTRGAMQWRGRAKTMTFARVRDDLLKELRLLNARHIVLSTNYELGQRSGLPLKQGSPHDKGVAVYFTLKGKSLCMACDRYSSAEGNIRSLTLAIAGMRALERHGGGFMMERAFAGFEALPPPAKAQEPPKRSCWEILGISKPWLADRYTVLKSYRNRAKECHPDVGGSDAAMQELTAARDAAIKFLENRERGK